MSPLLRCCHRHHAVSDSSARIQMKSGNKNTSKQFTKNCTRMPKNNNYQWQVVVVFVLDTSGCRVARTATCCFQEHRILCSTHVLKPTLSSSLSLSFTNSDLLVVTFPFFVLLNVSDETCHR